MPVPILAHPLASPEKGSGVAMICTFGDLTDVIWWRELNLPVRAILQTNGTLRPIAWGSPGWESRDAASAQAAYDQLVSTSVTKARTKIVELLRASGDLLGEPRPITHAVKFYEKGDRPLEIVTSRQWFIRTLPFRERLLERGRELQWHPPYMRARFENWVERPERRLVRQPAALLRRAVPRLVRLDADGQPDYASPLAARGRAAADGSVDRRAGRLHRGAARPAERLHRRSRHHGHLGDVVADAADRRRAGASIPALFAQVFPMSLRPQAHDIIRTWLFSTVLRAELEHGSLPWAHAAISGWVLDPDRKKMSKSKGNVVTPRRLLDEHGSDAVRYWAASGGPGVDTAFDPAQMKVGRRLAIKLLNASKFILAGDCRSTARAGTRHGAARSRHAHQPRRARRRGDHALDDYDYAKALQRTEAFFWDFCDNYVELVKGRRYGDARSAAPTRGRTGLAQAALRTALDAARCSRRTCRSRPRKCGRGGATDRCTAPHGRRRPRCWPGSAAAGLGGPARLRARPDAVGRSAAAEGGAEGRRRRA